MVTTISVTLGHRHGDATTRMGVFVVTVIPASGLGQVWLLPRAAATNEDTAEDRCRILALVPNRHAT